jgi:hypothetical protein
VLGGAARDKTIKGGQCPIVKGLEYHAKGILLYSTANGKLARM